MLRTSIRMLKKTLAKRGYVLRCVRKNMPVEFFKEECELINNFFSNKLDIDKEYIVGKLLVQKRTFQKKSGGNLLVFKDALDASHIVFQQIIDLYKCETDNSRMTVIENIDEISKIDKISYIEFDKLNNADIEKTFQIVDSKLTPFAVIYVKNYNIWNGKKRTVDEIIEKHEKFHMYAPNVSDRVLIKIC